MNLQKEEKKFWQKHFRLDKLETVPKDWSVLKRVDSQDDDTFFYFLTLRVESILEIHLKDTRITDEGIAHLSKLKDIETLYLRKHDKITKKSIPYFNKMTALEHLNITKTKITLSDLCVNLNNQNIKTLFLDSEENEMNIVEKAIILKERMPNCNIYLDTSFTTDVHGNEINPIF